MAQQLRLFEERGDSPDLREWEWILVNTSGGKDSQTVLRKVCLEASEAGVLDRVVGVHADLGRVEWPGVPELARRQAEHYGIEFHVVRQRDRHGVEGGTKLRWAWSSRREMALEYDSRLEVLRTRRPRFPAFILRGLAAWHACAAASSDDDEAFLAFLALAWERRGDLAFHLFALAGCAAGGWLVLWLAL